MDAIVQWLTNGPLTPYFILIGALIVGIIALRIVYEVAEFVFQVGCSILFLLVVGYILYTYFIR